MLGIIIIQPKWKKLRFFEKIIDFTNEDKLASVEYDQLDNFDYDFIVQNGLKKPSRTTNYIYEFAEKIYKEKNIPTLIREAPSLRKINNGSSAKQISFESKWFKLSWNSFFMDEGLFPYDPSYDRWTELSKKYDIQVHDWARRGDSILLNLQIDGDSALNRLTYNGIDYKNYIVDIIKQIQKISDRPLIVRGHPLDPIVVPYLQNIFSDIEFSTNQSLYEDLNRSWCMVTYNSTSCVESTLYGTPTVVLDSSAISTEVSQTSLEQIEEPWSPDRNFWCKKIAFHQWQGRELTDGYVWNLLKSLVWK
jgi:hypothetical protein